MSSNKKDIWGPPLYQLKGHLETCSKSGESFDEIKTIIESVMSLEQRVAALEKKLNETAKVYLNK